jgi:hypothetical protein
MKPCKSCETGWVYDERLLRLVPCPNCNGTNKEPIEKEKVR